jgi:5-methylcytosine-specific restriction protein B
MLGRVERGGDKFRIVPVRMPAGASLELKLSDYYPDSVGKIEKREYRKQILELLRDGTNQPELQQENEVLPRIKSETKNHIFFGPPGTGKTYKTTERALDWCGYDPSGLSQGEMRTDFENLLERGRVGFVTFHQSYGYEEFVEGIRPVIHRKSGITNTDSAMSYQYVDGAFKKIARRAESSWRFARLWQELAAEVAMDEPVRPTRGSGSHHYQIQLMNPPDRFRLRQVDEHGQERDGKPYTVSFETMEVIWQHRMELEENPSTTQIEHVVREANVGSTWKVSAYWVVYQDLIRLSEKDVPLSKSPSIVPQYVLIIDEINRGNISKIFGELITLLETAKRLGGDDELVVELPYSGDRFGVPPNLHVLGTMNTADRSIALMDVALRRRFMFDEMMPRQDLVIEVVKKKLRPNSDKSKTARNQLKELTISPEQWAGLVAGIMESINARVRFLYDRDHQLGHSYFMKAISPTTLRAVLVDEVIPLLQEYFYGSWDRVCIVLGCPWGEGKAERRNQKSSEGFCLDGDDYTAPLIQCDTVEEREVLGFNHEDYENQFEYNVNNELTDDNVPDLRLMEFFRGVLSSTEYKMERNGASGTKWTLKELPYGLGSGRRNRDTDSIASTEVPTPEGG